MLASALTAAAMSQDLPQFELEDFWFVYFVRGENRVALDEAGQAEAMEGHLGNVTRLWDEGKAVAAGPFAGDQDRRGIVILRGSKFESKQDAVAEFVADPLVVAKRLKVEVYKWFTVKGAVKKRRVPEEMKRYVFVVLDAGEESSALPELEAARLQSDHLRHIFEMQGSGELGYAGPFENADDMRGFLVFKHSDIDRAKVLVEQDPLIKRKRLKATYLVLWMAAGIVGD